MTWQRIVDYPIDYHINAGYRVQWHWEGGTRNKIWVATNPEGKTATCRSKDEAMRACDAGIAKRAAIARRTRIEESGELAEMKARGKAQIAAMREMMQ